MQQLQSYVPARQAKEARREGGGWARAERQWNGGAAAAAPALPLQAQSASAHQQHGGLGDPAGTARAAGIILLTDRNVEFRI